jgi:hypothetical protein
LGLRRKSNSAMLPIYRRIAVNAAKALYEDHSEDSIHLDRAILFGVRLVGHHEKPKTYEELISNYRYSEAIMQLIKVITPRRLTVIFPITKEYDGKRYGTKDYVSAIEMINKFGWDNLIDEPFEFLWDYVNWDITHFLVQHMSLMSDIRRSEGGMGIFEEWASEKGLTLYQMHTTKDGKQYLSDDKGHTFPVKKPRPKHLKLVHGQRKITYHPSKKSR